MGHNVGDQANRAVKKGEKVKLADRTPEQILKDIRGNLAANLFVTPNDQRWILSQYDAVSAQYDAVSAQYEEAVRIITSRNHETSEQKDRIVELESQVEQFRAVYEQENRGTALKGEIMRLNEQLEQFRSVYEQENRSTTLKVEKVIPDYEDFNA